MQNIARPPFSRIPTHYSSVSADHKYLFFVGKAIRAASLFQIPFGMFPRTISDGHRVINLPAHHHKVRPLGNKERIARTNFYIEWRIFPLFHRLADADQHPPTGLNLFQLADKLLAFTLLSGSVGSSCT